MNVAVIIYNGVELVDMNGPIDAFVKANYFIDNKYSVFTVAESLDPVKSESEVVKLTPSYSFDNCPHVDIIVIPGKLDEKSTSVPASETVVAWIKKMAEYDKIVMSVCVGFLTLANTGLLSGKKATTHYMTINQVHGNKQYRDIDLVKNVRYVEDGNFITTGGITSGIDGALFLIEKLNGSNIAQQVADIMVYNRVAPLPPYTILPPYYS